MMKTKYILKGLVSSIFLILVFSSCENYNVDVIDELMVNRVFSPLGVKTIVRNQTNVELNWTVDETVDHYVVEFSADDETFATIFKTINVAPTELPITVALEGETVYSIRVKAVSKTGLEDSKWVVGKATTLSEQIFKTIVENEVLSDQVTLRWTPNSNVTQITLAPGTISHTITAQEKISGVVTITGLAGDTAYTATLLNGTKKRGIRTFTTGVDVSKGTLVKPTDDLLQKIANAASGALLILEPGDYTAQTATITLAKSITIRGLRSFDKPKLKINFLLTAGIENVSLVDLDLTGGTTMTDLVRYNEASNNYGALLYKGCNIHDFTRSLVASSIAAKIISFTIDNSIVTNIQANSGDFIDFRSSYVGDIMIKNSTFANCSIDRDFIRIDAAAAYTDNTNVTLDSNTLHNVSNNASRRIFYVRFANNTLVSKNNIFDSTLALYANQSATNTPVFTNNNYSNAANLVTPGTALVRYDSSGSTLSPAFASAATGNFTISNQTLIDNKIGDPRWIK